MYEYLTFRKFATQDEACAVQELLVENDIPCVLEADPVLLPPTFIGQNFDLPYRLKIPSNCFRAADALLWQPVSVHTHETESDYYLLSFSDEELMEVIEKRDEWGTYDYALALQLLQARGMSLTTSDLERINQERFTTLATPDNGSTIWTVIGYLSALLGGMLGLFIGIFLFTAKKTLPDGSRMYAYSQHTRQHGKYIMLLGFISIPSWICYAVYFNGIPPGLGTIFGLMSSVHF